MKRTIALILALVLTLSLTACGKAPAADTPAKAPAAAPDAPKAPAEATTWRLAIDADINGGILGEVAIAFRDYINENSDKYFVEIYPNATLGNDDAALESLTTNNLEFTFTAPSSITGYTDAFNLFNLPYVVQNTAEGRVAAIELMDGEIGQAVLQKYTEDSGIKGCFITYSGFRDILNSKRDVAVPSDLNGLKIRTMENPIHLGYYNELGATAVTLSSSEAFTALQQGTIDGMDNVLDAMCNLGGWDVAKHVTLTDHFLGLLIGSMSLDLWNSLSEEDQALVEAGMAAARDRGRECAAQAKEEFVAKGEDMGVTFTEVDVNEWIPYAKQVWLDNQGSIPSEWFDPLFNELFG